MYLVAVKGTTATGNIEIDIHISVDVSTDAEKIKSQEVAVASGRPCAYCTYR